MKLKEGNNLENSENYEIARSRFFFVLLKIKTENYKQPKSKTVYMNLLLATKKKRGIINIEHSLSGCIIISY